MTPEKAKAKSKSRMMDFTAHVFFARSRDFLRRGLYKESDRAFQAACFWLARSIHTFNNEHSRSIH